MPSAPANLVEGLCVRLKYARAGACEFQPARRRLRLVLRMRVAVVALLDCIIRPCRSLALYASKNIQRYAQHRYRGGRPPKAGANAYFLFHCQAPRSRRRRGRRRSGG